MFLVDTSSWVVLAKYYLQHDRTSLLKNTILSKLVTKDIILIDKVFNECKWVCQKIVVANLPFLKDFVSTTEDYIAKPSFHKLLVNHLCNPNYRNLAPEEKEVVKETFLNGADCKLILYALENMEVRPIIVMEESQLDNDDKYFKKLPQICGLSYSYICKLLHPHISLNNGHRNLYGLPFIALLSCDHPPFRPPFPAIHRLVAA